MTADTATATVTVTVSDDSMDNVSITVNDSIVDIAGNPLIEAVDNLQTVDTVNPSTVGAPDVSDVLVTDTDDGTTLTVTFGFDEAMDQGIAPAVTFDPAVASTLILVRQVVGQMHRPMWLMRLLLMPTLMLTR